MAKNETATATALYKVNYSYVAKDGQLRAGAIVVDTTSAEEAKKEAATRLTNTSFNHVRITGVKTY